MAAPIDVSIVSASRVLAEALQQSWEAASGIGPCQIYTEADLRRLAAGGVLLWMPQNWTEFERLLPVLQTRIPARPWLIYSDVRIPGAFITELPKESCAVLAPHASAEELRTHLRLLAEGGPLSPLAGLRSYFQRGAEPLRKARSSRWPGTKELQVGCAISLGFTNPQIAHRLGVSYPTVKTHINNLASKLEVTTPAEIATYFELALTSAGSVWQQPGR